MRTIGEELRRNTKGMYGIEVEVEGQSVNMIHPPKGWKSTWDGSLRGAGAEFLFDHPVAQTAAVVRLRELDTALHTRGVDVDWASPRCSIHIHLNCQKLTAKQALNIIILYFIYENLLVHWCGPDREGNFFCLRASDAEDVIRNLRNCVPLGNFGNALHAGGYRYSALNICSLKKFGSLEFRSLSLSEDFVKRTTLWMKMLTDVFNAGMVIEDPQDVIHKISVNGVEKSVDALFGPRAKALKKGIDIEKAVFEGIRLVQDIVYLPIPEQFSLFQRRAAAGDYVAEGEWQEVRGREAAVGNWEQANRPGDPLEDDDEEEEEDF